MTKPLRVLAVGAAGEFAGLVVPELVKRGVLVRGLVTDRDHADLARDNGATEVAVGDLADRPSLDAALSDVDAVFHISPVFAPDQVTMGRNIVDAAKSGGVRRIVFSSLVHPFLRAMDNHAAKAPIEEAIIASGLEYTILHPTMFYQNYSAAWPQVAETGMFAEPYSAERLMGRVDYRDVAEVAAIAFTEDRLLWGTFELCAGNLDRHGVAGLMGEVLGREVAAETVQFDDWAQKAQIPPEGPVHEGLEQMYDWYDAHGFAGNALVLRAILGREPRALKAFFGELAGTEHR